MNEEKGQAERSFEWSTILSDDEFYPRLLQRKIRPAKWSGKEARARLEKLASDPLRGADRRFVAFVHEDVGAGTSPSLFAGIQILNPGDHVNAHRHNSVALYIITQGQGYTLLRADDGREWRIDWEAGDTFLCPAWYYHEHFCTGEEQALMYGIQDMPLLAELRALMFEEPAGAPVRQVQEGFSPQRDTSH
jgi:gentisate 1,2-dioxygenase